MKQTKSLNRAILFHILGWVIFILFIGLLFFIQHNQVPYNVMLKIGTGIIVFYINYYILIPKFLFKKKNLWYYGSISTLVILMTFIYTETKVWLLGESYHGTKWFILTFFLFIIMILGGIAFRIFEQWNMAEKRKLELHSNQKETELLNLKNQLNPHFLFNSLNSVYALTIKKSNKASNAVMMLSDLMRYMLYETNSNQVTLAREIEYIENYIELQKLQIANSSNINIQIDGEVGFQKIVPLILISFIENAFKYGTDLDGNTLIDIRLSVDANILTFSCENSIGNPSKPSNSEYGGIGLKNTMERLNLAYPDKHILLINDIKGKFKVNLTLNLYEL